MASSQVQSKNRGADVGRLTPQQGLFVQAMLADVSANATNAARVAGYKCPAQAGNKLLKNRVVAAALGKQRRLREERVGLNKDDLLELLANIVLYDKRRLYDKETGEKIPTHKLPKSLAVAMGFDRTRCLELLMKHLGMLSDKQTGQNVGAGVLGEALSRLMDEVTKGASNIVDAKSVQAKLEGQ